MPAASSYALLPFILLSTLWAQGVKYPALKLGEEVPDFSLPYATKDSIPLVNIRLSDLIGKRIILLAFYPADWSGGCTREVCTLRDNFAALNALDAEILAISGDYTYSHHEWAKHHNLQFKLLADHRHEVAAMYHSFNQTAGFNKRTVFLIDKEGKLAYSDMQYSTKDLTSFNNLKGALEKIAGK